MPLKGDNMTRIAYFDCFSGCSGDMILGALLDAGFDFETLKKGLSKLDLDGYQLDTAKVTRSSITGTRFNVLLDTEENHEHPSEHSHEHPHEHPHEHHHKHEHEHEHEHEQTHQHQRGLSEILRIIEASGLSDTVKQKSSAVFQRLGEVEAAIHGVDIEEIHFHEVGAVDSIVDIIGSVFALEALGIEEIYCSSMPTGNGTVMTAHGILPVPAPATLRLLADAQVNLRPFPQADIPAGELVTPTGAALMTVCAKFTRPNMNVEQVGYGAGKKEFQQWPNVLRVWIGEAVGQSEHGELVLLETNIDDSTPEVLGYLMELLFEQGALDVWFTPIQMKKNRPAVMLSVLGPAHTEAVLTDTIMRESSTLGIRSRYISRHMAHREITKIDTSLGRVQVKIKRFMKNVVSVSPEYEDCRRIARELNKPLQEVFSIVEQEARVIIIKRSTEE